MLTTTWPSHYTHIHLTRTQHCGAATHHFGPWGISHTLRAPLLVQNWPGLVIATSTTHASPICHCALFYSLDRRSNTRLRCASLFLFELVATSYIRGSAKHIHVDLQQHQKMPFSLRSLTKINERDAHSRSEPCNPLYVSLLCTYTCHVGKKQPREMP